MPTARRRSGVAASQRLDAGAPADAAPAMRAVVHVAIMAVALAGQALHVGVARAGGRGGAPAGCNAVGASRLAPGAVGATHLLVTQAEVLVVDAGVVWHGLAAGRLGRHAAGPLARAQAAGGAQVDLAAKADPAVINAAVVTGGNSTGEGQEHQESPDLHGGWG